MTIGRPCGSRAGSRSAARSACTSAGSGSSTTAPSAGWATSAPSTLELRRAGQPRVAQRGAAGGGRRVARLQPGGEVLEAAGRDGGAEAPGVVDRHGHRRRAGPGPRAGRVVGRHDHGEVVGAGLQRPAGEHPRDAVPAVSCDVREPVRRRRGAERLRVLLRAHLDRHLAAGEGQLAALQADHEHEPRMQAGAAGGVGAGRVAPRQRRVGQLDVGAAVRFVVQRPGRRVAAHDRAGLQAGHVGRAGQQERDRLGLGPAGRAVCARLGQRDRRGRLRPAAALRGDQAADLGAHPGQERQGLRGAGHQKVRAASRSVAGMARALAVRVASWRACAPVRSLRSPAGVVTTQLSVLTVIAGAAGPAAGRERSRPGT